MIDDRILHALAINTGMTILTMCICTRFVIAAIRVALRKRGEE